MPAFTEDQLELLQRAGAGSPLWGGSTALPRLARDVELLLALGLVATATDCPYRVTPRGLQALDIIRPAPLSDGSSQDSRGLVVGAATGPLPTGGP